MTNDARMEVRLPEAEKRAVFRAADAAGQVPSVYVRRVLSAALGGQGSGNTSSVSTPRQSGSAEETAPTESPAQPRTPASPTERPSAKDRRESAMRSRRADVGPKPLSATKPRPKAGSKPKGGKS